MEVVIMEKNKIKIIGKARNINYDSQGNPFFRWHGRRIYLEDCPRAFEEYETTSGKPVDIVGYYAFGLAGILLEFLDNGEKIRVWNYI
jgi:hypothetical protein